MELPEEMQEEIEKRQEKLFLIGQEISKIRSEAIAARKESGIEQQWTEDEEFYAGIDDMNRNTDVYIKPRSSSGGLVSARKFNEDSCNAFVNITRPFVDAASARMGDILLPANDWNFSVKPTPIPELEQLEEDDAPAIVDQNGNPVASTADLAKEELKSISESVEKAGNQIKDWLIECDYKITSRKIIDSAALVGSSIMKGPFPEKRRSKVYQDGALSIREEIKPSSNRVDHWDFFPDMNCGDSIHDGEYVFERDYLTYQQLSDLRGMPESGYIDSAISKVLKEGPKSSITQSDRDSKREGRFEVWYYYGTLKSKDLALIDGDHECGCDDENERIPVTIALVNETVIKGHLNPLGESFPFDVFCWQRILGCPFGIGVARQGRTAQKIVLAGIRALMDNMGLSAIPNIGIIKGAVKPADGEYKLTKGKTWYIDPSSGITSINDAIQTLVIPPMQAEMNAIIELGLKMMEDSTGISFLLQGQQGSAPDTVGGMNLLHQNASSVLRRCARLYDENITTPHIKRYHTFLLADPSVPDDYKGDLNIEAVGSSSLVEREIQSMQLPQILQLSLNPVFEKSPKKAMDEILKSIKFDPSRFDMDEEEKQQMMEMMQAQQQQVAPQVQAAQIRAEMDMQKEQIRQQVAMQIEQSRQQIEIEKIQNDTDRDTVFNQGVAERNRIAYETKLSELQLKRDLALLEYANKHQMKLDDIKAKLATETMKINSVKELAAMNATADQLPKPPIEPVGRAEVGKSFTQ